MTYLRHFLLVAALTLLSACGSGSSDNSAANSAPAAAPKTVVQQKPTPAVVDPVDKMPRAVGNGKPGAAVDIKYEFTAKPEVGKPVELQIALIPNAGVDSMQATFSGMDGITLAGELTASVSNTKTGEPYKHSLSVLVNRSGVYYITVAVNTQISGASLGRTFAIPFVAGSAAEAQKPQAAPTKDATGQAIQPMKAQETTR
jgi:hypothetical protein